MSDFDRVELFSVKKKLALKRQDGSIVLFIWRYVDASLFSQIYKIYFVRK